MVLSTTVTKVYDKGYIQGSQNLGPVAPGMHIDRAWLISLSHLSKKVELMAFSRVLVLFTRPTDCRKPPCEKSAIQGINRRWPKVCKKYLIILIVLIKSWAVASSYRIHLYIQLKVCQIYNISIKLLCYSTCTALIW